MVRATNLKKGMFFKKGEQIYRILETEHITPGKGNALMKVQAQEVITDKIDVVRWRSTDNVDTIYFDLVQHQILYSDQDNVQVMNLETYETIEIPKIFFKQYEGFIQENLEVGVAFYEGQVIKIKFPKFIEVRVSYTENWIKGDTVSAGTKPVTLETGAIIKAPLFINIDELIKVDVEEKKYVGRVSE